MTLIGWCPGGRKVDAMLATYQGTGVGRIFVGPNDPLPTWSGPVLGPLVAARATVHLSFKTNPLRDVLNWAAQKPAGHPLKLTMDHEPEQGPESGDPTLEEFHAGWAELLPAFNDVPMRDEIWLGPVYTRYWWQRFAGDLRWLVKQPVDFHGWDIYSSERDRYRTPDDLLTIPRQVAEMTGVPYLVAELGAVRIDSDPDGSGQAAWMRAMVDAVKSDGALTCCWYHKEGWDLLASGADLARQTWQTIIREETPVTTTAPDNLLAARRLLLDHLDMNPGKVVAADLDPAEVGIVGDPAHRGGYHCGEDRVVSRDYSVVESARDRTGLAKWACALDVGDFSVSVAGKRHDLRSFSIWLVAQCKAGTADTRDIREVIYSPDGQAVKRWDRLGKRTSGDDSHRWHTHISYHRDAIKAGRDQSAVFRRYLTSIGVIKAPAPTPVEDDMEQTEKLVKATDSPTRTVGHVLADLANLRNWLVTPLGAQDAYTKPQPGSPLALLLAAAGRDDTDEQAIIAGVLAGIDPATLAQRIAEHLPAEDAKRVADELAARLAS